jgi:hypothetical protein
VDGDRAVEVLAVDRDVVEVQEQAERLHPRVGRHPVDDGERVLRPPQRIPGRSTERLQEHRAADPRRRSPGEGQVLGRERVLRGRGDAAGPVAVERVEQPHAQPLPEADRGGDRVAPLRLPAR